MKEHDKIMEELSGVSEKLTQLKGAKEGFTVPKNYFKSLPDEVIGKIKAEQAPAQTETGWVEKVKSILFGLIQPKPAFALATLLILVAMATVLFFRQDSSRVMASADSQIQEIPDEALFTFVSNNIGDYDPELISTSKESNSGKELHKISEPSTEEMEQYLYESLEDIDIDEIKEIL
jgi:hypothetical protein